MNSYYQNDIYKKKYYKYKKKYNDLKNNFGGAHAQENLSDVVNQVGHNIDSKVICQTNRTITPEDIVNNTLKLKKTDCIRNIINTDYELSRQLNVRVGKAIDLLNFVPDIILLLNENVANNEYFTFSSSQDLNRLIGNFLLIETKSSYNILESNKPVKTYSIEGNIGTGKSTVIETLRNLNLDKTVIIEEPVHKWGPWLGKFLTDQPRHGLTFQLVIIKSYFDQIVNHKLNGYTVISERTPATGKHIFLQGLIESNNITKEELKVYYSYFNTLGYYPDIVYYLKVDPEISYKRSRLRGRDEELQPLFYNYQDFKEGKNINVEVLLFDSSNNDVWSERYKKIELSNDINNPPRFIKVNLKDISGSIIDTLGEVPNLKKGDWIQINFENKIWWIRNMILNNLEYLRNIHILHEKTFNPLNIQNFNEDNYFVTDSIIGNKKIKVYVIDASKNRQTVSSTIEKIHKNARFISIQPLLRSYTVQ